MQNTTERVPAMTSPTPVAAHPSHDVGEERIILRGVSWATYESLLADFVDRNTPHLTYDQGVLEIMAPSFPHGNLNRSLQDVFTTIADEREIDFINAGSTTFKRADLAKGFAPDTCFYIAHTERIREKREIHLAVDPPPDLVIEIDMTSSSLDKFPLYAQIACRKFGSTRTPRSRFSLSQTGNTIVEQRAQPSLGSPARPLLSFLKRDAL